MGNNKSKQESSQPEDSGYKYHITVLADVLESAGTELPLQKRNKHKNENQTEICENSSLRDEDKNSSGMKVDPKKEKKVQMPYSKSFVTDRNPQNSSLGAEYKNSSATASNVEKRRKLHMQDSKSFATVSSAQQTSSSRMSHNTDYRTVKHSATHLSPHLPSATVSSALKNPPPSKQNSDSSNQLIVKWPEKVKNDEKYTSDTRTSNTNTKCRGTAADVEKKKNLQIQDSKLLVSDKKPMKRKMTEIVKDMSPGKPLPKRKSDNKLIVNWPKKAKNTEKSNCDSHKTSTHSSSDGKSVELTRSTLVKDDEKNKMNPIVHTRQIQIPEMIRKNTSSNSSTDAVPALVTNTKQTGKPMASPKKITDPSDSKCQLAILGSNEKKKHTWDTESTVQHKLEFTIEKQLASNLPLCLSSTSVSETQKNPSSSSLSDNIESRIEKHSTTNLPPNLSSIAVSDTQKKPPPSSLSETTELRIKQSLAPNQTSPLSTSVSDSLKKSSLTTLNENKGSRTGNPSVLNLSSHLYSTSVSSSQKSTTLSLMNSTESRIEKPSTTNLPPNLSSIAVSDTQKKPPPSSLSETTELRIKQSLAPNQTSPFSTSVSDSLKKSSLTTLNENKGSRTGNPSVLNLSSHLYSTSVSSSQKSTTLSLMNSTESRIEKPSTTNLPPNLSSIAVSDTQKKPPPSSLSETTELRIKQSLAPNQTSPLSTSVSDSLKKSSLMTLNENKGSRTGNPSVLNLSSHLYSTSVSSSQKSTTLSLMNSTESRIEKPSTTNLPPNLSSIAVSDTQKKPPPSSLSETTELRIKQSLAPNQTSPLSTSVSDSLKKSSLTTLNENKGSRTGNPSVLNLSSHLYSTSVSSSQKSTTLSLMDSTESRIEKPSTTNLPPNLSSIAVSDTQKKPPPSSLSETTELRIKQSLAPNQTSPLSTSVSDSLKKSSLTTLNENKGSRTGNPSVLNLSSHLYSTSVSSSQKSTTLSLMDSTESRIEKPSTTNLPPNLSSIAVSDTQKSSSLSKNPESVSNDTVDYSSDKLALSHHDQTADHSANLCLNLIRQHVGGDGIYSNVDIGHSRDATKEDEFDIVYANDYCGRISCKFSGECVTHFHCSLPNCNFVTTTSSAMKQHRNNHHQFDDWIENGFRMFLKYESCCFSGCLESNKAKHVHCMRQGCKRIFHAPKQLLRHKQQHEQEDIQYAMNVGSMSLVAATSDGNVDSKTGSVFSVKQDMKHQLQNMSSGIVTTKKKISIVSSMLAQSSILSRQPKRKHPPETTVDTVPKVPKYADSPMIQPGTKNKFLNTAQNSNLVQIGKTEHIHRKISEESPLLKTCVKVPEDTQFKPKSASNKLSHNLSETDSVTYGAHSEFSEACSRLTPEFTVTVKIEQNRSFHEDKDDKFGAIDKNTLKNKSEISRSQQFDVVKKKSLTGKKLEKYNLNYDRLQSTSTSLKKNEKTEQYCKMDHIGSQSKKTNDLPVLATAPVFPLRKPKDQNNKNEKQKYSVMMKQLANAADCDSQFKPVPTQISTDMKLVKKEENIVLASSSGSVIPSSITQLVPTQIPTDVKLVKKEANTMFASSSDSVIPSSITQLVPAAMAKPYVKQDQSSHCVEPKWMKLLELVKGPDSLPQPTWKNMKTRMTFNTGSDCIPNCCLKSQKHYHCLECKTSFTLAKRLRYHINQHGLQLK